jgi:hypothetical protein
MKKSIAISLILHIFAISMVLQMQPINKKKPKPIEVELVKRGAEMKPSPPTHQKIIPLSPFSTNVPKILKKGYYGIGIYVDSSLEVAMCEGHIYASILINGTVEGYPGAALGLQAKDMIIEVGDLPISGADVIKANGPFLVNFTICRNGKKMHFTTTRTFIYND